jgi:hypothetical protein
MKYYNPMKIQRDKKTKIQIDSKKVNNKHLQIIKNNQIRELLGRKMRLKNNMKVGRKEIKKKEQIPSKLILMQVEEVRMKMRISQYKRNKVIMIFRKEILQTIIKMNIMKMRSRLNKLLKILKQRIS